MGQAPQCKNQGGRPGVVNSWSLVWVVVVVMINDT